jgi:hypothetical protein
MWFDCGQLEEGIHFDGGYDRFRDGWCTRCDIRHGKVERWLVGHRDLLVSILAIVYTSEFVVFDRRDSFARCGRIV